VTPKNTILVGDARKVLADLPPRSFDAVLTSPPYFRLRDYEVTGQLGQEPTITEWVESLRGVCRQLARVLTLDSSLWLNVNDTFSHSARSGSPRKSLLLGPERLLLALATDGWLPRGKIVWAKTNPMPESVSDRLARTWEPLYHLTRSPEAYFDLHAVRTAHQERTRVARPNRRYGGKHGGLAQGRYGHRLGKNPGDCWRLPKGGFRGQHFAVFPEALAERPICATVPERVCLTCGQPWRRRYRPSSSGAVAVPGTLYPACNCRPLRSRVGRVLDPFCGVGTTCLVAGRLDRDYLGIELNPHFARLARERLRRSA